MLQDNYGRRFHYLRLSITDVCNFSCDYCLPNGYQCDSERSFLSLPEIQTLVESFALLGTSKVRITGGEPALRKDLPDIIQLCKSTHGIEQVAMTTNGFNLAKQIRGWHAAGLDSLNVSIDSFDPRMFHSITGHNKLESILQGIDIAQSLDMPVKVNAVLMRQFNASEIDAFIDWVASRKVTLRLIELMQTGNNQAFFRDNHLSGQPIKEKLLAAGWKQVIRDKTAGPAEEFWHPEYQGRIGLIMPYSKDFCATCNRLRVSALGKLHLCLFAEQGLDLRHVLHSQNPQLVAQEVTALLGQKDISHYLPEGITGATKHLAMLGG